jgi:hypothetical protein
VCECGTAGSGGAAGSGGTAGSGGAAGSGGSLGPVGVCNVTHAAPPVTTNPGDCFASTKAVFEDPDPHIGEMWRMTQDGTTHDALNRMGDASGEQISFSPDSRFIVYAKTDYAAGSGENPKPSGIYLMDIATGVEQYLAPVEGGRVPGHAAFSRVQNEVLYPNVHTGSSPWVKIMAVDLETFASRELAHFEGATNMGWIAQNADASLIYTVPQTPDTGEDPGFGFGRSHPVVMDHDGNQLTHWSYAIDQNYAADVDGLWRPNHPNHIWSNRPDFGKRVYDVTASPSQWVSSPGSPPTAHTCWLPNGDYMFWKEGSVRQMAWTNMITGEEANPRKATESGGHPNCHPLDEAEGLLDSRFVVDGRVNGDQRLWVMTVAQAMNTTGDFPNADYTPYEVAHTYNSATSANNWNHAHPHWSPNGRYILFQSDVSVRPAGAAFSELPPGGIDDNARSVDLFIVPMP